MTWASSDTRTERRDRDDGGDRPRDHDQTRFVRADEVEAAWRVDGPVLGRPPPRQGLV
jgi:hypothetical protein